MHQKTPSHWHVNRTAVGIDQCLAFKLRDNLSLPSGAGFSSAYTYKAGGAGHDKSMRYSLEERTYFPKDKTK
jgi:hypothetical protein